MYHWDIFYKHWFSGSKKKIKKNKDTLAGVITKTDYIAPSFKEIIGTVRQICRTWFQYWISQARAEQVKERKEKTVS